MARDERRSGIGGGDVGADGVGSGLRLVGAGLWFGEGAGMGAMWTGMRLVEGDGVRAAGEGGGDGAGGGVAGYMGGKRVVERQTRNTHMLV